MCFSSRKKNILLGSSQDSERTKEFEFIGKREADQSKE
jgi:hypothetical protein